MFFISGEQPSWRSRTLLTGIISFIVLILPVILHAQTNTFPSSGNVGIGTTNPNKLLYVKTVAGNISIAGSDNSLTLSGDVVNTDSYSSIVFDEGDGNKHFQLFADGNSGSGSGRLRLESFSNGRIFNINRDGKFHIVKSLTVGTSDLSAGSVSSFGGNLDLKSDEYTYLKIQADIDNSDEKDNSYLWFLQDGDIVQGKVGFIGDQESGFSGGTVTGTLTNAFLIHNEYSSPLQFAMGGDVKTTLTNSGNFGIGTTNPTTKLTVNGTVKAEEIIVEENVGADFVLADDYVLPSLSGVEQHIKSNKHLPEIPSAKEMMANGVKVGELQMKLLQKIEELTLYVIKLEKQLSQSKTINDLQGLKLELLELQLKKIDEGHNE